MVVVTRRLPVDKELNKLAEFYVVSRFKGFICGVFAILFDDALPKGLVIVVVFRSELLAVRRRQTIERVTHQHELVVVPQAIFDLVRREIVEDMQSNGAHVRTTVDPDPSSRDVVHLARRVYDDVLPGGAGDFSNEATHYFVFVVNENVVEYRVCDVAETGVDLFRLFAGV